MGVMKNSATHIGLSMATAMAYALIDRPVSPYEWGLALGTGAIVGSIYSYASYEHVQ